MTDNTAEDFDVFEDDIDSDADEPDKGEEANDDKETKSGEDEAEPDKGEDKTEDDPGTPSGKDDKKESVPIAALQAERSSRQALQTENDRLRSKYEPDEEEPDPAEDPEAFKVYVQKKTQTDFRNDIVSNSRDRVMDTHSDDAIEMFNHFRLLSAGNKEIIEEYNNHPDPAQFAYDKGKERSDGIYAKALEQAKAELKGEGKDPKDEEPDEAQKRKDAAAEGPDLTGSTAVGSNSEPLETMEEDLFADSLFR